MKSAVNVVFDRRGKVAKCGRGAVEIRINLENGVRKYITFAIIQEDKWTEVRESVKLAQEVSYYNNLVEMMRHNNEPLTLSNINSHLVVKHGQAKQDPSNKQRKADVRLTDWIRDKIVFDKAIRTNTKRKKMVTYEAIVRYGKIKTFGDLTADKIKTWDKWLRNEAERTDVTIYKYHKDLKKWCRLACEEGLLKENPYMRVRFPRGQSKEREPLTEAELVKMRNFKTRGFLAHARDLFVFSAYTGLAYCDVIAFDFDTMTEKMGGMFYIDGSRLKTGSKFFTPILPPAMEVLKKYGYHLPVMSNQKANQYLHVFEGALKINKPITFHVARHSFATLCLSHDVPLENVSRMLGHTNIRTTQIYAKILKSTIEKHCEKLVGEIK